MRTIHDSEGYICSSKCRFHVWSLLNCSSLSSENWQHVFDNGCHWNHSVPINCIFSLALSLYPSLFSLSLSLCLLQKVQKGCLFLPDTNWHSHYTQCLRGSKAYLENCDIKPGMRIVYTLSTLQKCLHYIYMARAIIYAQMITNSATRQSTPRICVCLLSKAF